MADKASLKISDQPPIVEDDPFAELTRIMGFDPRQPAKPAAAAPAVEAKATTPEPAGDDADYGIDLERELMGDFGIDEPAAAVAASSAHAGVNQDRSVPAEVAAKSAVGADPVAEDDVVPQDEASSDQAADGDVSARIQALADENEEPRAGDGVSERGDSEQHWFRPASIEAEGLATDDLRDADTSEEDARAVADADVSDLPLAEAEMRFAQTEPDAEPVAAEVASLSEEHAEPVAGDEPQQAMAAAKATVETDAQDEDFSADQDVRSEDQQFGATYVDEQEQDVVARADDGEADLSDENAPVLTEARNDEQVAAVQRSQPVETVSPEAALEMSLEDELNALLGNEQEPVAADPAIDEPVLATTTPAQDDWNDEPAAQAYEEQPEQVVEQRWSRATPVDGLEWLRQNQSPISAQPIQEPAIDDELDGIFDDQALEAALSSAVAEAGDDVRASEPYADQTRESESSMPRDGHDPYAALAALSADLQSSRSWPEHAAPSQERDHYAEPQDFAGARRASPARSEAPEIETVDVPEQAVAVADDLDLPELAFEDEPARVAHYDDIDAEFSTLLQGMNASSGEPAAQPRADDHRDIRIEQPYTGNYGAQVAGAAAGMAAAQAFPSTAYDPAYSDAPRGAANAGSTRGSADGEFGYDPDFDEEIAGPAYTRIDERPSRRRGMLVAAIVGGVAVLGGVAAFALSFGDGQGPGEVALVKADSSPVKVKPENPGGTTVPNQDAKVYDSVAGAGTPSQPTQEKLLSSAEEPVEMPGQDDEPVDTAMSGEEAGDGQAVAVAEGETAPAGSAVKSEDRIEQLAQDPGVDDSVEVAAVAPRKVRTMIVKADGTLVAREEPAAPQPVDSASEGVIDPVASTAEPVGDDAETTATVPSAAAEMPTAQEPAAAKPRAASGTTPKNVPVAPARPSDQPVDIVGEVKAERVAALDPAAAPAAGSWSMQIASQPTEAAAQSSYQDLLRRYGGVLGGHQATIVKAEIAGKGTFWRVRVPAGGRNDAIKLCESYKSAGGNCFVSK